MANNKVVGRIVGSPLNGLCERVCIRVDCVVDACRSRENSQNATVALSDMPSDGPFTFVSAAQTGDAAFTTESVCPCNNDSRRVQIRLMIPINVRFTGANGQGCTNATLELQREVVLGVPENNKFGFDADAELICTSGTFLSDNAVSLTFCIVETYRTLVSADILVPSYGEAVYPDCDDCNGCAALMNRRFFDETR